MAARVGELVWRQRYAPCRQAFANPDRGFYRFTETRLGPDAAHVPLDAAAMVRDREHQHISVVFRYFYLQAYRRHATISAADLRRVEDDLEAARQARVSLVVRFAYADASGRDAPPGRAVGHIRQLIPLVNANADVVLALQAGFIGRWGEWYFTDHFAASKRRPWVLTTRDWRRRDRVLTALLEEGPDLLHQVRYPSILRTLLPGLDPRERCVGVHNDGFLGSDDDLGTFSEPDDREWLEAHSMATPVGGETCCPCPPRSEWPIAAAELERFHWTYLNADFDRRVLDSWGIEALGEVASRLGYRLRLVGADLERVPGPEPTFRLDVEVANDGYAAPVRARVASLVVRDGDAVRSAVLEQDTSTWQPGRPIRLTGQFSVPGAGSYDLALALPDPVRPGADDRPLAPAADVARSIRLANDGVWEAQTGWNRLVAAIELS